MSTFYFKNFTVQQHKSAMKVGTDAMLLGAFIDVEQKKIGLDIGAGTGVLSLMVAQRNEEIKIDAVEIDNLSFLECRLNFMNSSWNNRMNVLSEDFRFFSSIKKYDLIFSNPPYYSSTKLNEDIRKAHARHEQSLPSGVILEKVKDLLLDSGDFWVIIPYSEKEKWIRGARLNDLILKKTIFIKGKPNGQLNRVIICFSKQDNESTDTLFMTVRNEKGNYSDEYIALTKNYHSIDLKEKNDDNKSDV